jgi:hypothetical protein
MAKTTHRFILIVLTCCSLAGVATSQDNLSSDNIGEVGQRAYIETTDGSILMGNLISDNNKTVQLKIAGDNIVTIDHGFISDLKLEGKYMSFTKKGRYNINKGFFANIMPLGIGVSGRGETYTGQILIGYQRNERFGIGVGTGLENFSDTVSDNWYSVTATPVYGHIRYNLNLNGPRIYALAKFGYANSLNRWWSNNRIRTSAYAQLGLGTALPSRHLGRFVIELATSYYLVNGTLRDWRDNTFRSEFTKLVGRTTLRIGYSLGM